MSFICEIFEDLHILNKCVNKENQAVQSNTSSQLQKLSIYTRAATSTLVLITQLQGIGARRKAAVRPDCISAKKSSELHTMYFLSLSMAICGFTAPEHRDCALLEAEAAARGRGLVYCLLCTAAATPAIPRPGRGASFPYEKPALSLATGFPVSSAS